MKYLSFGFYWYGVSHVFKFNSSFHAYLAVLFKPTVYQTALIVVLKEGRRHVFFLFVIIYLSYVLVFVILIFFPFLV